jgi:RNAse (barnase) inhibitor barstar
MSGLAAVLAGREAPGIHLWASASDVADLRHTVEHAGWGFGYVDGWHHQTRREFLTAVGEALSFPDHYGTNLDALNDCLRDLPGSTVLLWDGWSTLAREDKTAFAAIRAILADHTATLTTLLRGEGPEVDVPSLD